MDKLIYKEVKNFIDGKFVSGSEKMLDVICPIDGKIISKVPLSGKKELDAAVESAKKAFPLWSAVPIKERVQVFYKYKAILEKNIEELSYITHIENGKTIGEARAEVEKSIELTEFACSLPQMVAGEVLEVSKGVECRIDYMPVGVVASIAPFNFPHMVPHWTVPNALALGNTMVFKPSEQVPITANHIAEMLKEAGLPNGVFNVVNGDRNIVEAICDHPGICAVSFVGSTKVAKIVYALLSAEQKII